MIRAYTNQHSTYSICTFEYLIKKDISKSGKTVPLRMFDYIQRSMKNKHDELDRVEKKKQAIQ